MRDVAVISFAQTPARRAVRELNEVEMLMPAIHTALEQVDMTIDDIGFTCSGSIRSARVVKPTRSANSTVTMRRSSGWASATEWPHAGQNRASAGMSEPHEVQRISSAA